MSLRNKLSLRHRLGGAHPLDRSTILSSNFSRRSLASSAPPSESINLGNLESTKLDRPREEEDEESEGSSPENKSLYYTAITSNSPSSDEAPSHLHLKDILFSGKKRNSSRNKEVSPQTLASDSEDESPFLRPPPLGAPITPRRKPSRGRRSSYLGRHEVILLTSESDDHEDEEPGPLTPRSPVKKVEDWLLSTSPIPSSPATPARVILSSSSSSSREASEDEGEEVLGAQDYINDLEDSEATSKAYVAPDVLNSIFGNMSLGDSTSKGGGVTLMETIREENEEDDSSLEVEILGIKGKRLSRGVQVELSSSSSEDAASSPKPSLVSVSIQAELDSSDEDSLERVINKQVPVIFSDDSEPEEGPPARADDSISSEDSDKALRDFISSVKKKYSACEEDQGRGNKSHDEPKRLSFSSDDEDKENNSYRSGPSFVKPSAAFNAQSPEIVDLSSDEEPSHPVHSRSRVAGISLPFISNEDKGKKYASFLSSLSPDMDERRRHPDAVKYVNRFESHKKELTALLYKLFNNEAFGSQLPVDMEIEWNPRLRKTAGICTQRRKYIGSKTLERSSKIGLSTKVLDSGDRLRDTLIHEMCHAAAWVLSGYRDGHGPVWKSWAAKAMNRFPELPIIDRCHNYQIRTKYTYKCEKCGYSIGRHSKSLDISKKCCGYCRGRFVLLRNYKSAGGGATTPSGSSATSSATTPRTPNAFATFVKDHYKDIKKPGVSHGDVMKTLSTLFKATKL